MRRQFLRLAATGALVTLAALQGCATRVTTTEKTNPPPAEAFAAFSRIEVLPIRLADGVTADTRPMARLQTNFDKNLVGSKRLWNAGPDNGRKLTVTPVIEQLEFTGRASRVLFGPLAGSSGVLMRLKIADQTGREIASPVFFQRAEAWAAGYTVGIHDDLMLTRVANLASAYLLDNYKVARGGPTGADDQAIANK
ncbi:hypothetical protein [Roseateles sp. L2-2]|uniref:hypothetical protein n=1 Tax=Roseateles TaxID=93681 RepID=UPI003D3637B0